MRILDIILIITLFKSSCSVSFSIVNFMLAELYFDQFDVLFCHWSSCTSKNLTSHWNFPLIVNNINSRSDCWLRLGNSYDYTVDCAGRLSICKSKLFVIFLLFGNPAWNFPWRRLSHVVRLWCNSVELGIHTWTKSYMCLLHSHRVCSLFGIKLL
jgi:hypothetical protein